MPEARLIDANALLKRLQEQQKYGSTIDSRGRAKAILEVIHAPTIEAEPARRGRWETWGYVFHGIEWKRCSRCGKCADVSYYGLLDGEIKMSTPAICGGCGARMDLRTPTEVQLDEADSVMMGGADNG